MCASNATDQCLLNNLNPTDPAAWDGRSCNQGSVSEYYIEVQTVEHIQTALRFSRNTGVRLSIKNSGHDYLGRSSLKGSLALWMRKWGGISRDENFIPEGCDREEVGAVDAITTDPGVDFDEVYKFANEQDVTIIGGYSSSVGATGGWVQAGGHSVLSPVYGLGIDRVLQYKIVTPDGKLRVANSCINPDLFWALRGGGGGTFGIVVEAAHRVEPQISLSVVYITYNQTKENVGEWLKLLVNNSLQWGKEGWGGHYRANNMISVTPLLNLAEAKASLSSTAAFALRNNGTVVIERMPSWYSFYTKYVTANEAAVGGPRILASRLIPASLFTTAKGRSKLLSFLNHFQGVGGSIYIPVTAPYLYRWDPDSTSATPAWRNSLWTLGIGETWGWDGSVEDRKSVVALQNNLKAMIDEMTPDGGSYLNEDSPWTPDWKEAWWGSQNYERLLKIKKKFDPEGILNCWKCVGFEEESAGEMFRCFASIGS